MLLGTSKNGVDKAPLTSKRLGITAYRRAQGYTDAPRPEPVNAAPTPEPAEPISTTPRALKSEVLRSLHDQSNSGMVSMKDVAHALDHILKRG